MSAFRGAFPAMAPQRQVASKSNNVRKVVKSIIDARVEHKEYFQRFTGGAVAAGAVIPITQNIADGTNINDRTGFQIRPQHLKIVISAKAATNNVFGTFRIIFFQDRNSDGTVPVTGDLLSSGTSVESYNGINIQNGRFKILKDWFMPVSFFTGGNGTPICIVQEHNIRMKGVINYLASTGASSNGKGSLYALVIDGDSNTNYAFAVNLKYTDA